MNKNSNDYLVEYNELLSQAAFEQNGKFSFLASPTLNKQETITFLYKDIINQLKKSPKKNLKHESIHQFPLEAQQKPQTV